MSSRGSGGLLACQAPAEIWSESSRHAIDPSSERPARLPSSKFGTDEDLASELPPEWSLRKFQEQGKSLIKEYFTSGAVNDAIAAVRDLLTDCPSEADEFGVLAIRAAVDRDEAAQRALVELLMGLRRESVLDDSVLVRSFEKIFCTWEDVAIDAPHAPQTIIGLLNSCITGGFVDQSLLTKLPENLLNAGRSKAGPELSEMLGAVAISLQNFKKQATRALEEFWMSLNAKEVQTFLQELNMQSYHHEFVKKAIISSFSQRNGGLEAREATVSLLEQLTSAGVLSKDDIQWGLTRLLSALDDLALDNPHCAEQATEFYEALVAGELVSVPFLRRCRLLRIGGATGLRVLDSVQRRTPEYCKRHLDTSHFKRELQTMILEFFNSGDEAEFGRCVRELAPLSEEKSAELIRKVMTLAMERSGAECELALKLLVWLHRHEELDSYMIEKGFDDMYSRMEDIMLDVPDANEMAQSFVVEAKKANVLRLSWPEAEEPEGN
jgi:hypothetical protein|mmetsp:Transcript_43510/g.128759  ORF Transcript_43510/g.128759 Transcript_43510/m.128759 type:complete len:495 (+) Transcript_43510:157-1641(+)